MLKQLINEITRLAAESPNNLYNRDTDDWKCYYNSGKCTNGAVGCIFGQALRNLGREVPDNLEGMSISEVVFKMGITQDVKKGGRLDRVQADQDTGKPWGVAIKALAEPEDA